MSKEIRISDDLTLFSGDSITLKCEDGTYLKRHASLVGHNAVFAYNKVPDEFSNFMVEVIDGETIRLKAQNGNYLKRFCCWESMNFVSIDNPTPDEFSAFKIRSKGGRRITLQADNGCYLKRFFGYDGKSVITIQHNQEDPFSIFEIARGKPIFGGVTETIKDIKFDLEQLHKSTQPFSVGSQILKNNSDEDQTMSFTVNHTVETQKSFNWERSIEIGASTTFETNIPILGAETTLSASVSFSAGGEKSTMDSQSFEATFPVNCRANTTMRAEATVQLGRVDVPYVATLSRRITDEHNNTTEYSYQVKGTYHGTNAFDLKYIVDEVE